MVVLHKGDLYEQTGIWDWAHLKGIRGIGLPAEVKYPGMGLPDGHPGFGLPVEASGLFTLRSQIS